MTILRKWPMVHCPSVIRDYHGSAKPARVAGKGLPGPGQGTRSQTLANPYPCVPVARVPAGMLTFPPTSKGSNTLSYPRSLPLPPEPPSGLISRFSLLKRTIPLYHKHAPQTSCTIPLYHKPAPQTGCTTSRRDDNDSTRPRSLPLMMGLNSSAQFCRRSVLLPFVYPFFGMSSSLFRVFFP